MKSIKTKTRIKAGALNDNHNQAKAPKATKKLSLSRETMRDLKNRTGLKAGAPPPKTYGLHCNITS